MRQRVTTATATLGLAAGIGAVALVPPAATAAEQAIVSSEDFEDGSFAPWTASGAATLSVVDADGDKALQVANRANDYEGIESPGLLKPGATYTLTRKARPAPNTAGRADIRFVVKPAYNGVGNTRMTADAWSTVTGTFTVPRDADPAGLPVYLGTSALSGSSAAYAYQVDDIVVTGEAGGTWTPTPDPTFVKGGAVAPTATPVSTARGIGSVAALTFDDGPNPGETEALLDFLKVKGVKATFCVIGQNIETDGGAAILKRIVAEGHTLCNHGTSYADMGSWTEAQIETDLKANLKIICDAVEHKAEGPRSWRLQKPMGGLLHGLVHDSYS